MIRIAKPITISFLLLHPLLKIGTIGFLGGYIINLLLTKYLFSCIIMGVDMEFEIKRDVIDVTTMPRYATVHKVTGKEIPLVCYDLSGGEIWIVLYLTI